MKGVIIAAGKGSRLAEHNNHPKPLTLIKERTLIGYNLRSLASVGIKEVYVVTGYMGKSIQDHIGDGSRYRVTVKYIRNNDWRSGNASSVLLALYELYNEPSVLVTMADHLVDYRIFRSIIERDLQKGEYCVLGVDVNPKPHNLRDATKVKVKNDFVTAIGRDLENKNGLVYTDCGVHLLYPRGILEISNIEEESNSFNDIKRHLVRSQTIVAHEINYGWIDVDTEEDLKLAEKLVRNGVIIPYPRH